jgi:dihydrofolate reductase
VHVSRVLFFMMVTANGLYERGPWEIGWHNVDDEYNAFAIAQLESVGTLMFGRVTYEGMASYWPIPAAVADAPVVTEKMNSPPKLVVSGTLDRAEWNNTRVVRGDVAGAFAKLKEVPGKDALVMGSSDLAASLAELGLIDEYRLTVNPIALGDGKPVLNGMKSELRLRLLEARPFASGNVLLRHEPERPA